MNVLLRRGGLGAALLAWTLLSGCGGTREVWQREQLVTNTPLAPTTCNTRSETGWLEITVAQPIRETSKPVERLTIEYETLDSTVDWDGVGAAVLYSLLGLLSIFGTAALYSIGISTGDGN